MKLACKSEIAHGTIKIEKRGASGAMSSIELCSNHVSNVTLVSNIFIDTYMPVANGSYVKVYLYLLRCISNSECDISISSIADCLEDSEKDIIRALTYWEKVNILTLCRDKNDEINQIFLNDLNSNGKTTNLSNNLSSYESEAAITKDATLHTDKPTYSPAQIEELTKNEEVKWLLKIVEVYLERFLKPVDVQLILYLYESVGFSVELIMYLYEYCVSKNKKNPSYIEAVAISWAEEGIDTVEKAEASTAIYNTNYNAVNKAFGLNRAPGNVERKFINKWLNQYGFDIDIIVEACNRTLLMVQKPDFKYADKIMENWYNNNVHHLNDVAKLDSLHKAAPKIQGKEVIAKPSNNKFNAFPQRNYTKEDYSSMEQRLLTK